jgi:hypothetical protein
VSERAQQEGVGENVVDVVFDGDGDVDMDGDGEPRCLGVLCQEIVYTFVPGHR